MFYTHKTFIGVDPTAGEKPIVYAAIDAELRLLALGRGNADDVLAFAAGQREAILAVCAPRQPNTGLMAQAEIRQNLHPPPNPGRWENFRLADYLLRQHGIPIPQTCSTEENCPNWMQQGFLFYRRLQALGYQSYPQEQAERQFLEVYPHAVYATLLDVLPLPKHSLEGRIQRQLALFKQELEIPDPMRFFEEITRHRLLKGVLPFDELYTPGELDALAAAYTAWQAATHPQAVTLLGDPDEGQVALPVQELKAHYE
jgi:hypothetical protein